MMADDFKRKLHEIITLVKLEYESHRDDPIIDRAVAEKVDPWCSEWGLDPESLVVDNGVEWPLSVYCINAGRIAAGLPSIDEQWLIDNPGPIFPDVVTFRLRS